jgi:selenophosphate synthase
MLLFDPQTSGGLLIAVAPESIATFEQRAESAGAKFWRIGRISTSGRIVATA